MAFSESVHILLCSTPFERTQSNPNEVRDVACLSQAVDLVSRPPHYSAYEG